MVGFVSTITTLLTQADEAFQAGHFTQAETYSREIIGLNPTVAYAHRIFGMSLKQQGQEQEAINAFKNALALDPLDLEACFQLAHSFQQLSQWPKALQFYQHALSIKPDSHEIYNNLGFVLQQMGQMEEALAAFQQALKYLPNNPIILVNIGGIYESLGQNEIAEKTYESAVNADPTFLTALNKLGILQTRLGKWQAALTQFQKALGMEPNDPITQNNLGALYMEQYRFSEAMACFEKALELEPAFFNALSNLAYVYQTQGFIQEAMVLYQKAYEINPRDGIRLKMATLLPPIYQSVEEIQQWRSHLVETVESLQGCSLDISDSIGSPPFFLAYQGLDDRDIMQKTSSLCQNIKAWPSVPLAKNPKPRIGFISRCFWKSHTIGRVFLGLIEHLNRECFDPVVISIGPVELPLMQTPYEHLNLHPQDFEHGWQKIADLKLDVLIYTDIGMDPMTYFLGFCRLARVQCVTWGHPVTTGMETIDHYLSSRLFETPEAPAHYTENLVLLDTIPAYYKKPVIEHEINVKEKLGLPPDKHLYLCLQSLFKFHPDFDHLIGEILRRDPDGILLMANALYSHWTDLLLERFQETIPDVLGQIRILERLDFNTYLNLVAVGDVALDPIHFGGGSTTYEALAFGTPVVTKPSAFLKGRMTYGCYQKMGVDDCVASNDEDYINIAVRLATNPKYRQCIQNKILDSHHVLYEDKAAVEALETFLWEVLKD